jgi:hypothetical protein
LLQRDAAFGMRRPGLQELRRAQQAANMFGAKLRGHSQHIPLSIRAVENAIYSTSDGTLMEAEENVKARGPRADFHLTIPGAQSPPKENSVL